MPQLGFLLVLFRLVTVVAQANFVVRICLVANHLHFLILRDSFSLQDGQCLSDVNPIKSRSFFFTSSV